MPHLLSEIRIRNYRSIIEESFEFSIYTPLVGYNNAGKTNILEAVKWLLRKSSLSKENFYNATEPVIIEGKIAGITETLLNNLAENHRNSISPYIHNECLSIRRIQNNPTDSVKDIKLYVRNPNITEGEGLWALNPSGIDNAIKDLFPEPIHIGAMEDAEEDVSKSKNTTTIGKLLSDILDPIENTYGNDLRNVLGGLRNLLDADGQNRAAELTTFDNEVNEKIDSFFPDVNIKLHVPTPELKDVFTKGTIRVYENGSTIGRDVSALGHGAQRSIQMALVRHLAELHRDNANEISTRLLLIDEPELYLHPQAVEIVRDSLKTLSNQGYQVIFSTHSPFMLSSKDVANTLLIRKNTERGTHRRYTLKAAIPTIEQDAPSQLLLMYSLSNSPSILFSEKVILTEGKTEKRLLPAIIQKISGKSIGLHKCALIGQGGVNNTRKSMLVLNVMDLPTKAIVDLDYALKNSIADNFLEANDEDVLGCKTILTQISTANNISLGADGFPCSRNGSVSASQAFNILASQPDAIPHIENIKAKLLLKNIWTWKKGTIEVHLNLPGKEETIWANFINRLENNDLNGIVPDSTEIISCVNWLIN